MDPFDLYSKGIKPNLPEAYRWEIDMPSWAFPVAFFGLLTWAGALTYTELRREKLKVDSLLDNKTKRQAAVDALEELRSEAIHNLLNGPVRSDSDVARFVEDQEEWRQRVLVVLRENFTRASYLRFDRLGVIPTISFGHMFNAHHQHQLQMLSVRLDRIMEITGKFIE